MCTENKLKELLTFFFKPANADHKNSDHKSKRIRVQTEKIKESKEQADIYSPKKKKSSCAGGNNESPKKIKGEEEKG